MRSGQEVCRSTAEDRRQRKGLRVAVKGVMHLKGAFRRFVCMSRGRTALLCTLKASKNQSHSSKHLDLHLLFLLDVKIIDHFLGGEGVL